MSSSVVAESFCAIGATLTSFTVICIVSESSSVGVPSSVTRIVTGNTPGPSDSVGVHENTPVLGSIVASAGAPASSENVNVFAGRSASVAVAVNDSSVSSSTV